MLLFQLKPRASVCREASDSQCDLAEYCKGTSEFCPDDVYMRDGSSCSAAGHQVRSLSTKCNQIVLFRWLYGRCRSVAGVLCGGRVSQSRIAVSEVVGVDGPEVG